MTQPAGWPKSRLPLIDAVRGGALLAMFGYHLSWDLAYFGLIAAELPLSPPFKAYAHATASIFLVLVGVSLVLARMRRAGPLRIARRIAVIAVAAASVSLATLYLFPSDFIFFGILHCIALSSLLALPFLAAPFWVTGAAALIALLLPLAVAAPLFDAPLLWWVGLGTHAPPTFDYRPLFPWLGMVLAGVALAEGCSAYANWVPFLLWSPRAGVGRLLAWAGRHSLLIYLVHQPLLLGMLYLAVQGLGAIGVAEASPFLRACETSCAEEGATPAACSAACRCLADKLEGGSRPAFAPQSERERAARLNALHDCAESEDRKMR